MISEWVIINNDESLHLKLVGVNIWILFLHFAKLRVIFSIRCKDTNFFLISSYHIIFDLLLPLFFFYMYYYTTPSHQCILKFKCPSHLNYHFLNLSSIGTISISLRMTLFHILFFLILLHIHLNIPISATFILYICNVLT